MEDSSVLQPGKPIKPKVTPDEIKKYLNKLYNFTVTKMIEMNGYDDINYHVTVKKDHKTMDQAEGPDTVDYVVKVINSLDSNNPNFFEAQTLLLFHLNARNICCPQPISTKTGLYCPIVEFSCGKHILRVLEFIDGEILHLVPCTSDLLYQIGEFAARINKELETFNNSVYDDRKSLWSLESAPGLIHFLYTITNEDKKNLVINIIETFKDKVLSISDELDKGIIHGDINEQNIIIEKSCDGEHKIKAIIDFGDSIRSCYLYELAIAMAYMILQTKNIYAGGFVLAGYTSVRKITVEEEALLQICIATRLCQSLVLGIYTSLQDPDNSYILTTQAQGWSMLKKLWNEPAENLISSWNIQHKETKKYFEILFP